MPSRDRRSLPRVRMTVGDRVVVLLVLVCVVVVTVGESRVYRHRFRTSWSRPYQTHDSGTTTANRDTTIPFLANNQPRRNSNHHHHPISNKHHLFNNNNNNNNNNNHRNLTRGHRTSARNHKLSNANHNHRRHNQRQYPNNHLSAKKHHNHNHNYHKNHTRNKGSGRPYQEHHRFHNNHRPSHGRHSGDHHSGRTHHHHHLRKHLAKRLANQNLPKQSIKRHLGGMKRHLHHQTPFLRQPMRMHTSFRSALSGGLSYHRRPQSWDMSRLRNHHERIMHHLSSRLRDHVMRMRSHSVPHVASNHYRHYPAHHRPSHSLHNGQRVHCRHDQPRQHDPRLKASPPPSGPHFKIAKGGQGSVPDDVEVFRWPAVPQSPPKPTTTSTTTTTTTTSTTTSAPRVITIDDNTRKKKNCTTSGAWRPHHTGPSRGRHNSQSPFSPTHPDPVFQNPILNALFPTPTPSSPPGWEGGVVGGSGGRHPTTSVQDHLNQPPHSRPTLTHPAALPCIKCPPDTHVQAPRGRDCVYAKTPTPLPCTSQWRPDVQTIVTEGPTPGTRLQEGHYAISFTVVVMEEESRGATPITTCRVGYDVEVRKCPELPRRLGLEARCSAGRAWGSSCTWHCAGSLQLQGAASTTCSGYHHPRWTHDSPLCVALHTPSPSPPVTRGCKVPPDVPGGHYTCTAPVGRPVNLPIPKDDPTVPRNPREITPTNHVEGTVCELECSRGRTITVSQRGRQRLTCTYGGHWDYRPPSCRLQVSPMLQDGDCKDTTLRPPHSPLSFLPLPNFRTLSGVAARVTCVLETRSEGSHTRTCTAEDPELETTTRCKYRITLLDVTPDPDAVLVPGLTGSTGKEHHFGDEAGREADSDDEREAERQHPDNEDGNMTRKKSDLYPFKTNEEDEDDDDDDYEFDYGEDDENEFDYYYDGSDFGDGDFIDDYDGVIETLPELQRVQGEALGSGTKRRDSSGSTHDRRDKKRRINWVTRNSTTRRRINTIRTQHLGKTIKSSISSSPSSSSMHFPSSSFSSLSSSSSSSSSSFRPTEAAQDVLIAGTNSGASMFQAVREAPQVSAKSSHSHHGSSERHNRGKTQLHKRLMNEQTTVDNLQQYPVRTNENRTLTQKNDKRKNAQLTPSSFSPSPPTDNEQSSDNGEERAQPRRPSDEQDLPATMEAVVRIEVKVGSCDVGREVARLLGQTLKDQEMCGTVLTCHNPRHTCTETHDRSTEGFGAQVELLWAVGGLYENDETHETRPHSHPHHVAEVETAISATLESSRGILTSQSLAVSLAALGAEVDPDSFFVKQLDLVCRQKGFNLQPETNRCWPD